LSDGLENQYRNKGPKEQGDKKENEVSAEHAPILPRMKKPPEGDWWRLPEISSA
jgi:hypothetical protein